MKIGDVVDFYFNREIPACPAMVVACHDDRNYGFCVMTLSGVQVVPHCAFVKDEEDDTEFFMNFTVNRGRVLTPMPPKEFVMNPHASPLMVQLQEMEAAKRTAEKASGENDAG